MTLFDVCNVLTCSSYSENVLTWLDNLQKIEEIFPKILENFDTIRKKLSDFVENFPVDGLYEVLCSYQLLDIYYPPCLHLSLEQTKEVFELLSKGHTPEIRSQVEQIIQEVYSDELITHLLAEWEGKVKSERFPILQEGIQSYFNGAYYASNAVLLTQVGGIISDNELKFSECDMVTITQKLDSLIAEQKSHGKTVEKEKNTLQRHLLINCKRLCALSQSIVRSISIALVRWIRKY
nr:hypothetical protein [uncultured Oscillibacter sp.]